MTTSSDDKFLNQSFHWENKSEVVFFNLIAPVAQ